MTWSRSYWPALDGLRGLAILLVVLAHAGLGLQPIGGQIGVTAFFVLSGFLITSILATEKLETANIALKHFYLRRLRRLLPGLLFFLLGSAVFLSFVVRDFPIWDSTWPGLFYVSNYAQILGVDVYANTHLWSLSVEEHFYAFWPLILLTAKRLPSATALFSTAAVMAALRLVVGGLDPNWAYHGTLTNSYALLIGCAIAVAPGQFPRLRQAAWLAPVGMLGLIGLSMWPTESVDNLLALGVWVPVIAAGVSGAMLIVLLDGRSFVFKMGWLRYVGRISYGWYLWHAPFLFVDGLNDTSTQRLGTVFATFCIAVFSWHVVEKRFLVRRSFSPASPGLEERTGSRAAMDSPATAVSDPLSVP